MNKKFKCSSTYLCILFSIALALSLFPYRSAIAQPKIEFTETEFDLGEMYQNNKKSHVFELKNTGTETLVIEKVKGG